MIEVRQLTKCYGDRVALVGLDLDAEPGDVLGLIGPNGAGKTTTMRILATLEQPDSGSARVAGYDVSENVVEVRARLGFMPELFGLYDELSVEGHLDFFARLYNVTRSERRRRVADLLSLCDLSAKAKESCGALSKGVRQRLYLARTLLADPPVLLLDEPASGLDPRARIELRELIRTLAESGKAILISSHILSELATVCSKVAIIENGSLRFHGRTEDLYVQERDRQITVELVDPTNLTVLNDLLATRGRVSAIEALPSQKLGFRFAGDAAQAAALLAALVSEGLEPCSFEFERADLESLFLDVTEGLVT